MPCIAADAARERIAVLGIEPKDDGDKAAQQKTSALARALTDGLRDRATAGGAYEIAPNSAKELLEVKLLNDCIDEGTECMVAIGRHIDTDILVYGHLEHRKDGSYAVTVQSLNIATKKPGPQALKGSVSADEATEPGLRKLATQAFPENAQPAHETSLVIETNVTQGTILVNGARRGTVVAGKATTIRGLPPGQVAIAIESPGYKRGETTVELKENEPGRAWLALDPNLPPAVPAAATTERGGKTARVLFWTSLVTTGVGVAAFTITGLQVRSIEKEQDDAIAGWNYKENGVQFPGDACREASNDGNNPKLVDICDRGKRMATITNVLIGATAVAAVATAIFYWRGYLAPSSSSTEKQARRGRGRGSDSGMVVFTPEVYKNGAGLGAVVQF